MLDGALVLELRDRQVALAAGEMYVVPKGVEHRPIAADECCVLLVEPRGAVNTGDAGGTFTAPNDVWIEGRGRRAGGIVGRGATAGRSARFPAKRGRFRAGPRARGRRRRALRSVAAPGLRSRC